MNPTLRRPSWLLLTAGTALLAACGQSARGPEGGKGTVIIATGADADFLLPPVVQGIVGKQVIDQIFDYLAEPPASLNTVGDEGYEPRLARKWTWSPDSLSIAFEIDPRARFHDGTPVRAADVKFSVALLKDPAVASPIAANIADVDSAQVRDTLTAVVWFAKRSPEQFFSLVFNVAVLPEHLLRDAPRDRLRESEFARHPVGSGRFRFAKWDKGSAIELVADTANYRGRPSLDRVVWSVVADPSTLGTRVLSEEADFVEIVRGDALKQVGSSQVARLVPYQSLDYSYVGLNLRARGKRGAAHPLFREQRLRRALAMAVDRHSIMRNVADTLAIPSFGPVTSAQFSADTTVVVPPFDTAAATALLDSLGWAKGSDGVRRRGGAKLTFALAFPSSSGSRRQMAALLQAQWKSVGVDAQIEEIEPNVFFQRLGTGDYDAVINAWHADPSPSSARQGWSRDALPERGGSNFGGYQSAEFDALIDSAAASFDLARSRALYRRAYERLAADVPAIWLYEPKYAAAAHRRLRVSGMRADAWWAGLADWSVDPGKRIARDRLGLVAAATGR